jgi:uncharacterized protein YhaN
MSGKGTMKTSIENELQEWEVTLEKYRVKLDLLKDRAQELTGEARLNYLEHIQDLEERIHATQDKMNEGKRQIEQMKSGAEDAFEELKEGSHIAWNDLKSGIGNAWKELKTSMDFAAKKIRDSKEDNR